MRKKNTKKFVLLVVVVFFTLPSFLWAGIRIDKPKIRVSAAPGDYASGEIKVENTGKEALAIKIYLQDWIYSRQSGDKEFLPKDSSPLSCSGWITFYPADIQLPANGSAIVRYTVSVPQEAAGGHYSIMFFETGGQDLEETTDAGQRVFIKVLNRIGALFYVEPQGTIQKSAEIQQLDISRNLNDLIVRADFINQGNTDITAEGTFNILDEAGYVYGRGEFDEVYTLPKDKAVLRARARSVNLKPGPYDLLVTLEFSGGGLLVKETAFRVAEDFSIRQISEK